MGMSFGEIGDISVRKLILWAMVTNWRVDNEIHFLVFTLNYLNFFSDCFTLLQNKHYNICGKFLNFNYQFAFHLHSSTHVVISYQFFNVEQFLVHIFFMYLTNVLIESLKFHTSLLRVLKRSHWVANTQFYLCRKHFFNCTHVHSQTI